MHAVLRGPQIHCLTGEFAAIITARHLGSAPLHLDPVQYQHHISSLQLLLGFDRQAFRAYSSISVNERNVVVRHSTDEVGAPNMVCPLRPEPHAVAHYSATSALAASVFKALSTLSVASRLRMTETPRANPASAPRCRIHKMPSSTLRSSARGCPPQEPADCGAYSVDLLVSARREDLISSIG